MMIVKMYFMLIITRIFFGRINEDEKKMFDIINFTPLKIYNGTPEGVPPEIQGQPLPINELNGTLPKGACPISNLHRFKISINNFTKFENFNDLEQFVQKYMLNIE